MLSSNSLGRTLAEKEVKLYREACFQPTSILVYWGKQKATASLVTQVPCANENEVYLVIISHLVQVQNHGFIFLGSCVTGRACGWGRDKTNNKQRICSTLQCPWNPDHILMRSHQASREEKQKAEKAWAEKKGSNVQKGSRKWGSYLERLSRMASNPSEKVGKYQDPTHMKSINSILGWINTLFLSPWLLHFTVSFRKTNCFPEAPLAGESRVKRTWGTTSIAELHH